MHVTLSEVALAQALAQWHLELPIDLVAIPGGFTSNVWFVDTPSQRFVAKYCYDTQASFDEGLRAAEVLDRAEVVCAAPIRTRAGELSVLVEGPHGRTEPLALLRFVQGTPFDWHATGAAESAGRFLGRIHSIWLHATHMEPQDKIFSYLAENTPEVAAQPGLQPLIHQAIANVRAFEVQHHVTYGPIIGDYVEILRDTATGTLGLIDCGAVGLGPLLFDVAIVLDECLGAKEKQQFLEAYLSTAPIQPHELDGIRQYKALHCAQLAKYFAWRLAHNVTMGDDTPNANANSLAEIRAALEALNSQ